MIARASSRRSRVATTGSGRAAGGPSETSRARRPPRAEPDSRASAPTSSGARSARRSVSAWPARCGRELVDEAPARGVEQPADGGRLDVPVARERVRLDELLASARRERRDRRRGRGGRPGSFDSAHGVVVEEHDEGAVGDVLLPAAGRFEAALARDDVAEAGVAERDVLAELPGHRGARGEDGERAPAREQR